MSWKALLLLLLLLPLLLLLSLLIFINIINQSDTVYRSLLMPGGVHKQKVVKFSVLLHLAGGPGGKAGRQRHHASGGCHPSLPSSDGHCQCDCGRHPTSPAGAAWSPDRRQPCPSDPGRLYSG